jgi:cell division protein ZapA
MRRAFRVDETKSSINRVTVRIFNEEYVVKGEENPEYIEMLASFVDRRMKMIQQRNPNLSSTKVAVLTALNLADELNKLQEDYDELVKNLEEEKKSRG